LFLGSAGEKGCFSYTGEQEIEKHFSALPGTVVSSFWFIHSALLAPFAAILVYSLFLLPLSVSYNNPGRRLTLGG